MAIHKPGWKVEPRSLNTCWKKVVSMKYQGIMKKLFAVLWWKQESFGQFWNRNNTLKASLEMLDVVACFCLGDHELHRWPLKIRCKAALWKLNTTQL